MSTLTMPQAPPATENGEALYEIVNGIHVELLPMGIYSVSLASALHIALGSFVRQRKLGRAIIEGLFILSARPDLRRRPDLAFVSAERWPLDRPLPETGDWEVIPDLAVEVVSPNDLYKEVLAKIEEYFRHGVRQVWLVQPSMRQVYVYDSPTQVRILAESDTLENTVVPGFVLAVAELFQAAS